MRVLGIVGSMRKNRHTDTLVHQVLSDMKSLAPGINSDILYTADKTIRPCQVVCSDYCSTNSFQCSISDDVAEILAQMMNAEAILLAAPLYFRVPPAGFHALAERLTAIFYYQETQGNRGGPSPLAGKPCGLISVAEYSNPQGVLEYLHDFCTLLKMRPVALDAFPYLGVGGQGDIDKDAIFRPLERSRDLAGALVEAVKSRS